MTRAIEDVPHGPKRSPLPRWQKEIVIFLHRVMLRATEFFRVAP